MVTIINVADLTVHGDPQARTYRQVNADKTHTIPLGTLVELDTGERLRVMLHTRDCDMTPMYSLGVSGDEDDPVDEMKWRHGYCDESLTVVTPNASFSREPERSGGESAGSDS
jgi:hypothetical protein